MAVIPGAPRNPGINGNDRHGDTQTRIGWPTLRLQLVPLIDFIMHNVANIFSIAFPVLWLAIGLFLGAISGWYRLMARFPDRPADPILRLYAQSGSLGPVNMGGILTLTVCRPGLRVSVFRVFGLLSKPFLVPWNEIAIARGSIMLWPTATLRFGDPLVGSLVLRAPVADRLARAAGDLWPEHGPIPQASTGGDVRRAHKVWVLSASLAGGFFACVLMAIDAHKPLLVAALVVSAVACGLGMLVAFFMKRR